MAPDSTARAAETPIVTKLAFYGLWLGLIGQAAFGLLISAWPLPIAAAMAALGVAVGGFLIFMISRRRNWARITYAVIYGLACLLSLPTGFSGPGGIITLLKYNLQFAIPRAILEFIILCAVILLFLPASNAWFRQRPKVPTAAQAG